ncbi:hypothetical protein HDU87_008489 [Geranomyces variabilis]|uniref:Uncharacterized protein n=1 Tax=Geranomyces variabilis TaxID=109894 RepID=A0AAD5TNN6_9FUNG|nr:hypothetical protein HDU87_008489 [Geranomyces variabilis]
MAVDPADPTTPNGQQRTPFYNFNKLYIYGLPKCPHESTDYWEQRAELKRRFPSNTKVFLDSSAGRAVLSYSSEDDRNYDAKKNVDVKYKVKTHLKTIKTIVVHGHVDILSVKSLWKLPDQPWVTLALRAVEVSIYFSEGSQEEYKRVSKERKITIDGVSYRVSVQDDEKNTTASKTVSPPTTPAPWASSPSTTSSVIAKVGKEPTVQVVKPIEVASVVTAAAAAAAAAEGIAPAAEDYRMPPPPGLGSSSQHVEITSASAGTITTVISAATSDVSSPITLKLKDALKLQDGIAQLQLKAANELTFREEEIARLKLIVQTYEEEKRAHQHELKAKDHEIARLLSILDDRGSELRGARKELSMATEQLRAATMAVEAERAAKHKFEGETGVYKSLHESVRVEADAASNEARQLRAKHHGQTNILMTRSMLEHLETLRLKTCAEPSLSNGTTRCQCTSCITLFENMLTAVKNRYAVVDKFTLTSLRQQISWSYNTFCEVAHPLTRETIDVKAFDVQRGFAIYGAATVLDWPHEA